MAGDYTRFTFDSLNDYASVLMQQGRVQLDADFNELVEILDRRLRADTVDIIGRCTVPKETPDGFNIALSGGTMTIGRGRLYADGILAENHGEPPSQFDDVLSEMRGTKPTPYMAQPYFPNPPALPTTGSHLVYLDVWRREVTALEDPDLIEKAVGVDTATRLQTIWQVKIHSDPKINPNMSCDTPNDQVPGWLDVISPSAGRLTTEAQGQPASDDPCIIAPNGGFRGTENRLYRVEVHAGGALGAATFKWSRDNASIATRVTGIDATRTLLTVVRTGRDAVLRFSAGDWVEVTDDNRELAGLPGEMRKVQTVDDVNRTITLTAALPSGMFPTNPDDSTVASRHTRVRRWDQRGLIRDPLNNVIADVDASGGVITVPAATTVALEDGVQITFSADPAGGKFKTGDFWVFAARTADASVERLKKAPPRGIHHHYCRLAFVTFPNSVTDCRHLWPPDVAGGGCDCTVCVSPESHNSGELTIQRAIDMVKGAGGKVCLEPGQYLVDKTIEISGTSVHVEGHGAKTMLIYRGAAPAMLIRNALDVTVEKLALFTLLEQGNEKVDLLSSVVLRNCFLTNVRNCIITNLTQARERGSATTVAIRLEGVVLLATIRENELAADAGIVCFGLQRDREGDAQIVITGNIVIEDNAMDCVRAGVISAGLCAHFFQTGISGNQFTGCNDGGIAILGLLTAGSASHLDIDGNTIAVTGPGITIGTDMTRITDNDITGLATEGRASGILITSGVDQTPGIDHCQVIGNRIRGFPGDGISIDTTVNSAMIKQNTIEGVGGGGIVMQNGSSAGNISIENNQLFNITNKNNKAVDAVGIRLFHALQADVTNNKIVGVGRASEGSKNRDGILALLSLSVRIVGNEVFDVGTEEFIGVGAGIRVIGPFSRVDVIDNEVRRNKDKIIGPLDSRWFALAITDVADVKTDSTGVATIAGQALGKNFAIVTTDQFTVVIAGDKLINLPAIGSASVAVRGNLFEGHGNSNVLALCEVIGIQGVATPGAVMFNDNRCLFNNTDTDNNVPTVVRISSGAIIVSANYVQAFRRTVGMELFLPGAAGGVQPAFTALGNISSGSIRVNGADLAPPWVSLNVVP